MTSRDFGVSVVIPTYNRSKYVTKAIDSVLAQTYHDYEIIVVDDGSADDTRQVLQSYKDRIHYIYQKNSGASSARNTGIQAAKGEWVAFLDSDDEWLPGRLAVAMEEVAKKQCLVAHFANLTFQSSTKKGVNLFELRGIPWRTESSQLIDNPLIEQLKYQFCFSSNFVGRREALFKAGLFDEKLTIGEDFDLFCRLGLEGLWCVTGRVLVHIVRRDEPEKVNLSRQRNDRPIYYYECLVRIYDKLRANGKLQPQERLLVNKAISGAHFNLGIEHIKAGNGREGFVNIRRSVSDSPSVKSLAKYLFVRSFGGWGISRIEKRRSLVATEFRRSDFEDRDR